MSGVVRHLGRRDVMRGAAHVPGTAVVRPPRPASDDAFYFGSGGSGSANKSGDGSGNNFDGLYDSALDVDEEYLRAYKKVDE